MTSKNKRQRLVFSEKLMYSFINDYRESGCLWDIRNPDYKSADKRRAAITKLAAKYDITEEEAKKKLNSLRSTYLQEKKKVEESKRTGGDIYVPSLYWYSELEFLYDVIIPRRSIHPPANTTYCESSPANDSEHCQVIKRDESSELINQEVDQEHLIFEFVPDGDEKTIFTQKLEPTSYVSTSPKTCSVKTRKFIKRSPSIHQQSFTDQPETAKCVQSVEQPHSPQLLTQTHHEDEFDTFCCSIASQLRTLPPADAIEMQLEIQQLVSRRRLAVLKNQTNNLSILRSWGNAESYHNYHSQPSPTRSGGAHAEKPD